MEIKVFVKSGFFIIENMYRRDKIELDSIDSILIFHEGETFNNRINFYLDSPIIYEPASDNFMKKALFKFSLLFRKDTCFLEERYDDDELVLILTTLNENLKNVFVPNDIEKSLFWRTTDDGYSFPRVKLIYSKFGDGLKGVLLKHNKMKV